MGIGIGPCRTTCIGILITGMRRVIRTAPEPAWVVSAPVESGTRGTSRSGASSAAIGSLGAVASRAATSRNIPEELGTPPPAADGSEYQNAPSIRIDMPEPVMAPTSPTPATGYVPVAAAPTSTPIPVTALSVPSQTPQAAIRLSPQPTIIVAPPVINASLASTFRNIVAALTEAWPGGTPVVPADASLVSMLGTARREERAAGALRTAVTAPATAAKTAAANTTTTGVEAEKMTILGTGRSVTDRNASGGYAIALSGAGKATATVTLPAGSALTLRLRSAAGAPDMTVSVDGVPYTTLLVEAPSYADCIFAGGISAGTHIVSISSTTATTRNTLYIDKLTVSSGPIVDEFTGKSGSALSRLWTVRSGTGFDVGNQTYAAGNAFLDGQGHLVIQATRGRTGAYTSGWVWTKNNMTYGYGTITVRAKMPKGQGLWPAVRLMGANSDTVGWPACGEIDIVELPSTTTTVYSTLHGPIAGTSDNQQAQIVSTLPDLSKDYHNYWVKHLENSITFGVDGRTLGTLTPANLSPGETWVYNRPMYLILNLAVGGPWAGAPNSSTPATSKMLVESVTFAPA